MPTLVALAPTPTTASGLPLRFTAGGVAGATSSGFFGKGVLIFLGSPPIGFVMSNKVPISTL
jgi:hypothetical protein